MAKKSLIEREKKKKKLKKKNMSIENKKYSDFDKKSYFFY